MRKLISIRIDPKTYQTAREVGLNISKTCENSLKQQIQLLTTSEHENHCISTCDSMSRAANLVARERFELSSEGPKPSMLVHYTTGLNKSFLKLHLHKSLRRK